MSTRDGAGDGKSNGERVFRASAAAGWPFWQQAERRNFLGLRVLDRLWRL